MLKSRLIPPICFFNGKTEIIDRGARFIDRRIRNCISKRYTLQSFTHSIHKLFFLVLGFSDIFLFRLRIGEMQPLSVRIHFDKSNVDTQQQLISIFSISSPKSEHTRVWLPRSPRILIFKRAFVECSKVLQFYITILPRFDTLPIRRRYKL